MVLHARVHMCIAKAFKAGCGAADSCCACRCTCNRTCHAGFPIFQEIAHGWASPGSVPVGYLQHHIWAHLSMRSTTDMGLGASSGHPAHQIASGAQGTRTRPAHGDAPCEARSPVTSTPSTASSAGGAALRSEIRQLEAALSNAAAGHASASEASGADGAALCLEIRRLEAALSDAAVE